MTRGCLPPRVRVAEFFEKVVEIYPFAKRVSNLLMIDPTDEGISRITPTQVADLLKVR